MTKFELQEYVKCARDPIYFLNTYGYVYDITKKQVDRLNCFIYQEDMVKKFQRHQNNIVLKSRQLGLSVITAGFVVWTLLFRKDQRILIVANDGAAAVRFLSTVKQFMDYLPKFFYDPVKDNEKNNEKYLSLKNGNWVKAVASSKQAGRGEALTMLILDEVAFIENADDIWMGAGLALTATKGKCIMVSCVPKDTYVFTNDGIKQIENFINKKEYGQYHVDDYVVLGKDKSRKGNLFFSNGVKPILKIEGVNSYLEGTLNHKVWAFKNGKYDWYEMADLSVGDYFCIQYNNELWGNNDKIQFEPNQSNKQSNKFNTDTLTPDLCYLIGLYISEGSVYKKKNKKGKFIGGSVTITCGDDVSDAIVKNNLKYSSCDKMHYSISSKNFIEFLEYLGFDLSKRAKEKEIPQRLLEISRENMIGLLQGIMDGDGFSEIIRGTVGFGSTSLKLVEQVRMILLNFGILTDFNTRITKKTKKVNVESTIFTIQSNDTFSKIYYEKIGFRFSRKQNKKNSLEKSNLKRSSPNDIIPESLKIITSIINESNLKSSDFKEKGINIHTFYSKNPDFKYKTENLSRQLCLKIFEICKPHISNNTIEFFNIICQPNLKWNCIKKISEDIKETYDFSLPEIENDVWSHSILYNGIVGHQTPYGTGNLYHRTWVGSQKNENPFVGTTIHWTEHPVYSIGKELRKDEFGRSYWWSPWYEGECERFNYDRIKIAQELDLSFEGSRAMVVDSAILTQYEQELLTKSNPICYYDYTMEGSGFVNDIKTNFWVWEQPVLEHNYIISADVGRGDGADYSTIQVIDANELKQVAEYQGKIPPDLFAHMIYKVALEYNKAYVVIECNSFGLATCLVLKNQLRYDSSRIYHSKSVKKMVNHHWNVNVDESSEIPGFQTTVTTRPLIIASLTTYMRDKKIDIRSRRLVEEFKTFIYNGIKPEHAPGYHDDLIIAMAIGLYIRDTEFSNVFISKDFYKSMLEAFSHQTTENKYPLEKPKQQGIQDSQNKGVDDDLSWLYG